MTRLTTEALDALIAEQARLTLFKSVAAYDRVMEEQR